MRLLSLLRFSLLLVAVLSLGACSSTKLTDSWDNDKYTGTPTSKVMVVGMMKDMVTRRFFEQHFVAEARKQGIDAIASYEHIPNPTDHDQRKEVVAAIKKSGAGTVIVAQMKGVEKVEGHVPSRLDWYPDAFHSDGFYTYYYRSYRAIYRPGYIASDRYLKMQVRYFDVESQQLLWAGNLSTKNPKSLTGTVRSIADKVVGKIKGSGFL